MLTCRQEQVCGKDMPSHLDHLQLVTIAGNSAVLTEHFTGCPFQCTLSLIRHMPAFLVGKQG